MQPQIRRLVTHSIPGLNEEQVTVVLFPAQPVLADRSSANSLDSAGASLQQVIQQAGPVARVGLLVLAALAALGIVLSGALVWGRLRNGVLPTRTSTRGQES